jgi:hypothetical protein
MSVSRDVFALHIPEQLQGRILFGFILDDCAKNARK